MDIFDFFRGFMRPPRDPFSRPFDDDDLRGDNWSSRHPGSFDPPGFDDEDEMGFFGFRDYGSPIDDIFRTFERHMGEVFGGFEQQVPPSAFGFGIVDGPGHDEDERLAVEGAPETGKSLRDQMLKAPGARVRQRSRGFDGDTNALVKKESDLDHRIKEGGLDALLQEEQPIQQTIPGFFGTTRIMSKSVMTRRIGDKVVTVTETVLPDGRVETNKTIVNMDENELPKFEQQWSGGDSWSPFDEMRQPRILPNAEDDHRNSVVPHEHFSEQVTPRRDEQDTPYKLGIMFRNVMDTFSHLFGR